MTPAPLRGHLEPLSAVLRIGGAYGEPYRWAATVRYLSPSEVELVGVVNAPTPSEWRAIRLVLVEAGVRAVRMCRRKGVTTRSHVLVR